MTSQRIPCLMLATALGLTAGCNGTHEDKGHQESRDGTTAEHTGVTYSEKKGLRVPPATAQAIHLTTEEVSDRTLRGTITFNAQVYSTSTNPPRALASALVEPRETETLKVGKIVEVRLPDGPVLAGQVLELKTHWEQNGGTEVLLAIDDPKRSLVIGHPVVAQARTGETQKVVTVPAMAVLRTLEGKFVYTVSGEHFVRTAVKTGETNAEFVEIKDGLYAGDQVVTRPAMALWLAELQAIRGGQACADGD